GIALTIEIFKYVGPALMSSLSDLKPVQIKDLQEQFEKIPPTKPTPTRFIRSEQIRMANEPAAAEEEEEEEEETDDAPAAELIDMFDMKDPVKVLEKLPSGFYENVVAQKWQERKEALDGLLAVMKDQKIEDARYHELCGALAKRIDKDSNIIVAVLAVNCIEALAKGLKGLFSQYRSIVSSNSVIMVFGALVGKLKEKKQNVVEALRAALDAVFDSFSSMNEIAEEVATNMAHKNPGIRLEVMTFVARSLKKCGVIGKPEGKILVDAVAKVMDDSVAEIRDAAADALGTLLRVLPERAVLPSVEKLDSIKSTKVREFAEKAETKVVGGVLVSKGSKKKKDVIVTKPVAVAPATAVKSFPAPATRSTSAPKTKTAAPSKKPASAGTKKPTTNNTTKKEDDDAPL
ncbi:hypothetical protein HK096_010319, partial [Nowakowskiella sp. JEL0078]